MRTRQLRRTNSLVNAAIIAPLIAGHIAVFIAPGGPITLAVYMLGYVASLTAASIRKEFRHLLLIPAAGFAIGLVAEIAGVNAGIPFGKYEYVSLRAPRVLGVPLSVPVMWGFYTYLMYLIASSIITRGDTVGAALRVAYASLLMVTLDLAMDPFMVNKVHAWVWLNGWGPKWFGTPASNYIGWFIVSLAILTTHEIKIRNSLTPNAIALTIPYACLVLFFASSIGPELVAPIAALLTALLAVPAVITQYLMN